MKIVHVIARFNVGGTATWLSTLSRELEKQGHVSHIVTGNANYPEIEATMLQGLSFIRIPGLGRSLQPLDDFRALIQIRSVIKKIKPDLVNTHTAKAGVLGRIAVLSLGCNRPALVHTIHGHLFTGYFGSLKVQIVIFIERLLSRYTDVMLFAGERVRNECLESKIGKLEMSVVVKPGVRLLQELNETTPLSNIDIESTERLKIGWLGRITQVKRPDRVVEIARRLPDIDFLIGGDGELRKALQDSAPLNCRFLGWVNPLQFWSEIDIALLTSDNEALPISIIEAQLCALPCVVTNAGSTSEVVLDGINGYVTSMEIDEIVARLSLLSRNPKLRQDFGQQAKVRATREFSPERQVLDHLGAYERAIVLRSRSRTKE
jgi:glycosyltransferase involved in cell wall biosynthesis